MRTSHQKDKKLLKKNLLRENWKDQKALIKN
jgi:hypothetical protein